MPVLSIMLMLGYGLSCLLVLVSLGLVMEGVPQGCPLSMMFIVALYLPWCRYLAAHEGGFQLQLYADNLKCVSTWLALKCCSIHHWLCPVGWSRACSQ